MHGCVGSGLGNPARGSGLRRAERRNAVVSANRARADFARSNFMAEVTVTLKGGGGPGCAFFGLGRGEANPQAYNEPARKPVVFVRFAPERLSRGDRSWRM